MVVQVVVLAEDLHIQALLAEQGVQVVHLSIYLRIHNISNIYLSTPRWPRWRTSAPWW